MDIVKYRYMRFCVVDALESLADPERQRSWGIVDEVEHSYEDLDYVVHMLYDDMIDLRDPEPWVGAVIFGSEVEPLRKVNHAFEPLLDEHGDIADEFYLNDPRWPAVIAAAGDALEVMRAGGQLGGPVPERVVKLIAAVVRRAAPDDADVLVAHAKTAVVTEDVPGTSMDFEVPADAPSCGLPDGPLRPIPAVRGPDGGLGAEVLVWVRSGRLLGIEQPWTTDEKPTVWPHVSALVFND